MYMSKAWRIGDDGVGNKMLARHRVRLDARSPEPVHHGRDHLAILLDIALSQSRNARYQPGIADHVRHQRYRVTADWKELEP